MENDKRIEELQNENARLRELLSEVLKAYDILDRAVKACPVSGKEKNAIKTLESRADVKKLLKKYSRL